MTTLSACIQGSRLVRAGVAQPRRSRLVAARAVEPKQDAAPSTSGSQPEASTPNASYTREFTAWGARIIESDGKLSGPEDEKDFWEGDNMDSIGKVFERYFLPGLVVLGVLIGGIAARTYNDDADVFIKPPPGPDADVVVIPAGALAPAPTVVAPAPAAE
ncbi:hypothetical protein GPECTOR_45g132 [Gonium pectorale]|uniref:Uncharacterized protein n=1 Tax=Gonium pectorale TaxID=33097 RepID=A0A150G8T6_GONPE|nr:hypothetical protein GPECTOR_45g132 [Gonium pectorale]|eukprot:KXZ46262.1 hypothetical protein GPECTOR_45g132 [Gonium pectorale]